ncbi:hypothetical protein EPN18_01520 [bacterium]|nr:MAG: hypothetical protein EPN18_01520 [bacterium]
MRYFLVLMLAALLASCTPVISKGVLKEVERGITVDMVQKDPAAFTGRKTLWGGVIIASENLENFTRIEVLETGLAWDLTPHTEDYGASKGRFLIDATGYLDTAIFKKGKKLTTAGTVNGIIVKKIGKMDYAYPIITPIEMRLFEPPPLPPPSIFYLQTPY